MKTRNITPVVQVIVAVVWVVGISIAAMLYLPAGANLIAGASVAVAGVSVINWFFRGERLWIRDGRRLPFSFMWKPRGYTTDSSFSLTDLNSSNEETVVCSSCYNEFERVRDHFRSDNSRYCPDCSQVGELVMDNYQDWFETTQDVRE